MAHEIETHGTRAAALFAREDAWHRLGTTVADAFTAQQALTLGHLGGWDVRTVPLTAHDVTADGVTPLDVPMARATVRTSPWTGQPEPLAVVGPRYVPIQNEDTLDTLQALADESGAIFDTAGSLRGGRQVFVSLRLPQHITVGGVDPLTTNVVALNSHDASQAFTLLVTPVRVVCANTQAAALRRHSGRYTIRHTAGARVAVAEAREALGMAFAYVDAFEAEAEAMIQQAMADAEFDALTRQLFTQPPRDATARVRANYAERDNRLMWLWADAATNAPIRGTRWAAYQAITEYVDHYAPVRPGSGTDEATARAHRLLTTSEPERIKARAFDLCAAGGAR